MNCKEFVDFLSAYTEGELELNLRAAFDRHVGDCPPCMCYLDGYKKTGSAARVACTGEAKSAEVPEALVAAILAARAEVAASTDSTDS